MKDYSIPLIKFNLPGLWEWGTRAGDGRLWYRIEDENIERCTLPVFYDRHHVTHGWGQPDE